MVRVTRCTSPEPSQMPSNTPNAVPTTPNSNASPSTPTNSSRRLTPKARSIPNRARRCTTEKVMAL